MNIHETSTFKMTKKKKQLKITKKKSNKNRMGEVVEMANKIGNQAWVDKPKSWRGLTYLSNQDFGPLYLLDGPDLLYAKLWIS